MSRRACFRLFCSAAVLLLAAAALLCLKALKDSPAGSAEVLQQGTVVLRIDLRRELPSRHIRIPTPGGGFNELLAEGGRVRVIDADCPGKDCVKMGWLRSPAMPLVCLPHGLTVRLAAGSSGSLDGVSR